jgi:signal transduction histidine kinase
MRAARPLPSSHRGFCCWAESTSSALYEAGRLDLESTDFSIRKCVDATVRSIEPLAAAKGLQVLKEVDEGVPDWVRGDPHRCARSS